MSTEMKKRCRGTPSSGESRLSSQLGDMGKRRREMSTTSRLPPSEPTWGGGAQTRLSEALSEGIADVKVVSFSGEVQLISLRPTRKNSRLFVSVGRRVLYSNKHQYY